MDTGPGQQHVREASAAKALQQLDRLRIACPATTMEIAPPQPEQGHGSSGGSTTSSPSLPETRLATAGSLRREAAPPPLEAPGADSPAAGVEAATPVPAPGCLPPPTGQTRGVVLVSSPPSHFDWQQVTFVFGTHGRVLGIERAGRGDAVVCYESEDAARAAVTVLHER